MRDRTANRMGPARKWLARASCASWLLCLAVAGGAAVAQPAARDADPAGAAAESWPRAGPGPHGRHWRALTPEERRALREQLNPEERDAWRRQWLQQRRERTDRGEMPPPMMMSPEARRQMREQIREAQRRHRERMHDERRDPGN